jgi:hypothetical protein
MSLASKSDLQQDVLLDVLSKGAMACPLFAMKGPSMTKGEFPPAFPLKHQQKDMRLACELGCDPDRALVAFYKKTQPRAPRLPGMCLVLAMVRWCVPTGLTGHARSCVCCRAQAIQQTAVQGATEARSVGSERGKCRVQEGDRRGPR